MSYSRFPPEGVYLYMHGLVFDLTRGNRQDQPDRYKSDNLSKRCATFHKVWGGEGMALLRKKRDRGTKLSTQRALVLQRPQRRCETTEAEVQTRGYCGRNNVKDKCPRGTHRSFSEQQTPLTKSGGSLVVTKQRDVGAQALASVCRAAITRPQTHEHKNLRVKKQRNYRAIAYWAVFARSFAVATRGRAENGFAGSASAAAAQQCYSSTAADYYYISRKGAAQGSVLCVLGLMLRLE